MKINLTRETLLNPLQYVIGAVERRQTKPILANVLLKGNSEGISLTATDLEIEIVAYLKEIPEETGEVTLPARKLLDICRNLPDGAKIDLSTIENKIVIKSAKSRFTLVTLPASDFPILEGIEDQSSYCIRETDLKLLLEKTAFAMAQQDVRYYLNGLLLEISGNNLRSVATDGHRMGMFDVQSKSREEIQKQVIIPRKGVLELQRLLEDKEEETNISITSNHLQVRLPELRFTSKLIDGRFPDYMRVIPQDTDKILHVDKERLRQSLTRASILSNEKFRGVRLILEDNVLRIQAHNPEQEEAEEEVEVSYNGDHLEIGFNVNYLLDLINAINNPIVEFHLKDPNSGALAKSPESEQGKYVVMPMRL